MRIMYFKIFAAHADLDPENLNGERQIKYYGVSKLYTSVIPDKTEQIVKKFLLC
jgi:hypothetical protein